MGMKVKVHMAVDTRIAAKVDRALVVTV